MKRLIFEFILKPLILRNYRLREESALNGDGQYPDEWYWADTLGCQLGYAIARGGNIQKIA